MPTAKETWSGRGGTGTYPNKRVYTRVFEVTTDTNGDDANAAAAAVGIVQGDPYPSDPRAVCVSVNPTQREDSPRLWLVTYGYDSHPQVPEAMQPAAAAGEPAPTPPTPAEAAAAAENPLTRPPVWKVSFQQTQEPAKKDRNNDPILNTARLPFNPPVMIDVSRPVVSVTFNKAAWSLPDAEYIQDAVNSDTWFGMEPRTLRVVGAEAQSMVENNVSFWQITYQLSIRRETWDVEALNAGFMELVLGSVGLGTSDHWRKITDEHGAEPTEPYPLDANGAKLAADADPIFLKFRVYREVSFATNLG